MTNMEEYLERLNLEEEIEDKYKISLDNKHFQEIDFVDIIFISVDNSSNAIDEHDGSSQIKIIFDIRNNQIIPSSNPYFHESIANNDIKYPVKCQMYTESNYSSISQENHNVKRIDGNWMVSDMLYGRECTFHNRLTGTWGDINDENKNSLDKIVNSHSLYMFLIDVLAKL